MGRASVIGFLMLGVSAMCACFGAEGPGYPREEIYDTAVHQDEALVNVGVATHRWPDCTTLRSAVRDMLRLEGVEKGRDEDKALALWKWFRILVSATGGAYAYELGDKGRPCLDPHKIFTVYGHHQCDGMSWAMVALWRAADYMALDQCHWGHTIASLRYRDDDGQLRYHDFDPQGRFYYWDETNKRVGTWTNPIMRAEVHRHVMAPQRLHSLRTSLRVGESVERKWTNDGHVFPHGKQPLPPEQAKYYDYQPGKTNGVYASAGEEIQALEISTNPEQYALQLYDGSANTACSKPERGKATLHPAKSGEQAAFICRLAPPYLVVEAKVEAVLVKAAPADTCRLLLSTNGTSWTPIFDKEKVGEETVTVDLGKAAHVDGRPTAYTAYDVFVKAEFQTAGDARGVGMNALKLSAIRMLNKRTLPQLRPGENYLKVTADRIASGFALRLDVEYEVDGAARKETRFVRECPYYFKIDVPAVAERILKNYDQDFNSGALRMRSLRMELVSPRSNEVLAAAPSLREAEALAKFTEKSPHPADMTDRKVCKKPETDVRQTNGFFPQADRGTLDDEAKMKELIALLNRGVPRGAGGALGPQWLAAEDLGDYPKAVDALLEALPRADIDLTLFICKALARNPDKKMIGPLLDKWKRGDGGSPGTRYIPDVLAAIGDRSVVPALVAPLRKSRFDFRFHIAYALGILGGPEAEKALEDLAANDPFPPVRDEGRRALEKLKARPK